MTTRRAGKPAAHFIATQGRYVSFLHVYDRSDEHLHEFQFGRRPSIQSVRERSTEVQMAREIFPSSYECDCGHQSHFFERTIREMKADSHRRPERIADSEPDEHIIVFHHGKMIEIICPTLGRCKAT